MAKYVKKLDTTASPQYRVYKTIKELGGCATELDISNNINRIVPPEAGLSSPGPVRATVATGLRRLVKLGLVEDTKDKGKITYHLAGEEVEEPEV